MIPSNRDISRLSRVVAAVTSLCLPGLLVLLIAICWLSWMGLYQRSTRHSQLAINARRSFVVKSHQSEQTNYRITDIGPLSGYLISWANGINNSGQVAIVMLASNNVGHSFIWHDGTFTNLGTWEGNDCRVLAISENGKAVGGARVASGDQHPFLWDQGRLIDLGTLQGKEGRGLGLNAKGLIVGVAQTKNQEHHAFVWQQGAMQDLGPTLGSDFCYATGVNSASQVTGMYYQKNKVYPYIYQNGKVHKLPLPDKGGALTAAINAQGDVIGTAFFANNALHAFLYKSREGKSIDLGTLGGKSSESLAMNDGLQVVGKSDVVNKSEEHAFLWKNGKIIDLNSLIPPHSGWELIEARGINARGQIVGWGSKAGSYHAFLLTQD